ncbi:MAG TPA: MarC family protein [Phenylobacterium sp.]|jgi:multiple antibiotic resistance protein|uniref:MarC family protein n=1 Tax=Phenylobacterium sp. TaxID=1871053 RepID=UPI002C86ABF5|nr:MarC family protein [Phenylobacterium sp.]HXA40912.1 MarC family protein [Phenylobacterium sp.]
MIHWDFAVNFFVALFALLDPPGNVPVFVASTAGATGRERAQIAFVISLFVMGFLTLFYFTGLSLLAFFGISLPAFRIAGGVILFVLGLKMLGDDFTSGFADAAEDAKDSRTYVRRRVEQMIVPFAMPLLIGPGAISTVIIYASQAKEYGLPGAALGVGAIAAVSVATLLSFLASPIVGRLLGKIGLSIIVRVLGLILCAMAVQFLLAGIAASTHGLIRPEAAAPYAK